MKLSTLLATAATAGLGLVSAAPIRVVVVAVHRGPPPSSVPAFPDVRFGHAAASQFAPPFGVAPKTHHKCGGFRDRMNRITDEWRKLFGLEPITEHETRPLHPPVMNFHNPFPSAFPIDVAQPSAVPSPVAIDAGFPAGPSAVPVGRVVILPHPHPMDSRPYFHHQRLSNFWQRLGHALEVMGPWEGRAIAFVLGCGIGVLLRMVFVFGILLFRSRRCVQRSVALPADDEDSDAILRTGSEEMRYPVEKEPILEESPKSVTNA